MIRTGSRIIRVVFVRTCISVQKLDFMAIVGCFRNFSVAVETEGSPSLTYTLKFAMKVHLRHLENVFKSKLAIRDTDSNAFDVSNVLRSWLVLLRLMKMPGFDPGIVPYRNSR